MLWAGGKQGCHGNGGEVTGCCSTSVGTHYATSHLSLSVSLLISPQLYAPLSFPHCLSSALWVGGARGVVGGKDESVARWQG